MGRYHLLTPSFNTAFINFLYSIQINLTISILKFIHFDELEKNKNIFQISACLIKL